MDLDLNDHFTRGIEFIDLTDVDETEKLYIQKSLAITNSIPGPWCRAENYNNQIHHEQQYVMATAPNLLYVNNNSTVDSFPQIAGNSFPPLHNEPSRHIPFQRQSHNQYKPPQHMQFLNTQTLAPAIQTSHPAINSSCTPPVMQIQTPHQIQHVLHPSPQISHPIHQTSHSTLQIQHPSSVTQPSHLQLQSPPAETLPSPPKVQSPPHQLLKQNSPHTHYINNNDNKATTPQDPINKNNLATTNGDVYINGHQEKPAPVVEVAQATKPIKNEEKQNQTGKSWASLFNTSKNEQDTSQSPEPVITEELATPHSNVSRRNSCSSIDSKPDQSLLDDPLYYRMGEYLQTYVTDNRVTSLQPRGLINRSNYCYINAILQAILACPPAYNLLYGIGNEIKKFEKKTSIPMISGMVEFVKEFRHLPAGQRVGRRTEKTKNNPVSINCERPFEPICMYTLLSGKRSDSFLIEGRQEDAEEFLGCLLNGLNDEMVELLKLIGKVPVSECSLPDDDGTEWQFTGHKNKSSVMRKTEFAKTPITEIFRGHLRSRIHKAGEISSENIQPFFTLQLNIANVSTLSEALEVFAAKNKLEGVTSSKTNEEIEAWQQVNIEELPLVLILHLKCFNFKQNGSAVKIIKPIEFPISLKIDQKLLSQSKSNSSSKGKHYKLFSVVYHDGKEVTKGHYLTDAYHVGYGSWLRLDDATVKPVSEEQVLKPQGNRVPYLLFYRRCEPTKNK